MQYDPLFIQVVLYLGTALWLGLPAWFANGMPLIFGGGTPIDLGKNFRDGKRILGDGKTIRGFIAGLLSGIIVTYIQTLFIPQTLDLIQEYTILTPNVYEIINTNLLRGCLLSLGALFGDLLGSFIKRRRGMKRGEMFLGMDQLGFIIFAILFALPVIQPDVIFVLILLGISFIAHILANVISYLIGIKNEPH